MLQGDATDVESEATPPTERSSDTEAGEAVDEAASKPGVCRHARVVMLLWVHLLTLVC